MLFLLFGVIYLYEAFEMSSDMPVSVSIPTNPVDPSSGPPQL
jgi:hypothetical protein